MVALAVQMFRVAVDAVAALDLSDGGGGVGGGACVRVGEVPVKLDAVLIPVSPQDALHLQPQREGPGETRPRTNSVMTRFSCTPSAASWALFCSGSYCDYAVSTRHENDSSVLFLYPCLAEYYVYVLQSMTKNEISVILPCAWSA